MTNPTPDRGEADSGFLVEIQAISKAFPGVQALSEVGFSVHRGELHALVGENGAGKSTLMRIIGGSYTPDSGQLVFDGAAANFRDPIEPIGLGIKTVYQELNLVEQLTVAANVHLGGETGLTLPTRAETRAVGDFMAAHGIEVNPAARVRDIPIGQRQLVEIVKAVYVTPKLLIMDEPTSSLSMAETEVLFKLIAWLKEKGVTIIYISHKLQEVFRLADTVTVLRDGKHIITGPTSSFDSASLIRHMVDRDMDQVFPERKGDIGEVVLRAEGFSRRGVVEDGNFEVRRGEIVGFMGLMGAGRTELMRLVYGLDGKDSGRLELEGRAYPDMTPYRALREGLGLLPEDRKRDGLLMIRDIRENLTLCSLRNLESPAFVSNRAKENAAIGKYGDMLRIKYAGLRQKVKFLSGGNQQKVIIARWLMTHPRVLIVDELTRGIDVGAKREIYGILRDLAAEGIGIVMVSSELEEIVNLSDRIYVMRGGRIVGEFDNRKRNVDAKALMGAALGEVQTHA